MCLYMYMYIHSDAPQTKSKVAAKTGNMTYQWDIMKSLGIEDSEIKR